MTSEKKKVDDLSSNPDANRTVKRGAIPTPPAEIERAEPFIPDRKAPPPPLAPPKKPD